MVAVYQFTSPDRLFGYLANLHQECQGSLILPTIFWEQHSDQYYITESELTKHDCSGNAHISKFIDLWATRLSLSKLSQLGATTVSLDHIVSRLHVQQAWSHPRAFDAELLIMLKRTDFEYIRDSIFYYERGSSDRLDFSLAYFEPSISKLIIDGVESTKVIDCCLRLRNLHSFLPIAMMLQDTLRFGVYYPCYPVAPDAIDTEPAIYVEWGYDLNVPPLIEDYYRQRHVVYLISSDTKPVFHIIPRPEFYTISEAHDLNLDAPCETTQLVQQSLGRQPPFQITVTLDQDYAPSSNANDEVFLESRLRELEAKLTNLRLNREPAPRDAFVYAFEESHDVPGVFWLREIIERWSLADLKQFHYARCDLNLAGRDRIFHLLTPENINDQDRREPENATLKFYRDPEWYESTGFNIFLPIDNDGRRFRLYPNLMPRNPDQASKFVNALIGTDNAADPQIRPYTNDLLLLCPDDVNGSLVRVLVPQTPNTINLSEARRAINIVSIKHTVEAKAVDYVEDVIGRVLEGAQRKVSVLASALEVKATDELNELWQNVSINLINDIKAKTSQLDAEVSKLDRILQEVHKNKRLLKEADKLIKQAKAIEQDHMNTWNEFAATVNAIDQHAKGTKE